MGESVAIAEQVGEVGAAKGQVGLGGARGHPGTLTDTELLSDKTESMLLAVHQGPRARCGLAWLSVTQGPRAPGRMHPGRAGPLAGRVAPQRGDLQRRVTERFEQQLQVLRQAAPLACPRWPAARLAV